MRCMLRFQQGDRCDEWGVISQRRQELPAENDEESAIHGYCQCRIGAASAVSGATVSAGLLACFETGVYTHEMMSQPYACLQMFDLEKYFAASGFPVPAQNRPYARVVGAMGGRVLR